MLAELRKLNKESLERYIDDAPPEKHEIDFVPEGDAKATWWVQQTAGTTYWRCLVPAKHFPGQALHLRYSDFYEDEEERLVIPRQRGDAAVWQFVGVASRALVMAHQQEQGLRVLMEVDDNYLGPPPIPVPRGQRSGWSTSLDRRDMNQHSYRAHRKIVRWVDGLIVSTDELAERYARATSAPIYVCPNSIDLADWPHAGEGPGTERTGISIGYAGSVSHRYDVALVERALDWAAREDDVSVWAIGLPPSWRFPFKQVPWANDLAEYRANLRVLDVGLCPLKRSDWHDCKSDIKAMEYLLAGVVPIVQGDSPCYRDWVGVVPSAVTEKDWLKAVKWAVGAPREELREVWARGYAFLLEHKLIEKNIAKWRSACSLS